MLEEVIVEKVITLKSKEGTCSFLPFNGLLVSSGSEGASTGQRQACHTSAVPGISYKRCKLYYTILGVFQEVHSC